MGVAPALTSEKPETVVESKARLRFVNERFKFETVPLTAVKETIGRVKLRTVSAEIVKGAGEVKSLYVKVVLPFVKLTWRL